MEGRIVGYEPSLTLLWCIFCLSGLYFSNCVSITSFSYSDAAISLHVLSISIYTSRALKVATQMGCLIGFVPGVNESNLAVRREGGESWKVANVFDPSKSAWITNSEMRFIVNIILNLVL